MGNYPPVASSAFYKQLSKLLLRQNLLVILFTLTHPSKRIKTDERKVRSSREICLKLTINTSKKKS